MEREITITVTDEEARRIDERVAAGEFASAAELAHAAVSSVLADPDLHWLTEDVVRQLIEEDETDTGPDIGIDEAFAQAHRHIDELVAKRNGKP